MGRSFSNDKILSESNSGITIDYNDLDYLSMLDPEIDWDNFSMANTNFSQQSQGYL